MGPAVTPSRSGKMTGVSSAPQASSILVVDDDEPIRDAVERGLALHGYAVAGAPDAETATAMIARRRPDLLVLDIGLPGISGIELCRRLRDVDVDVPILVLSARDQVGEVRERRALGGSGRRDRGNLRDRGGSHVPVGRDCAEAEGAGDRDREGGALEGERGHSWDLLVLGSGHGKPASEQCRTRPLRET